MARATGSEHSLGDGCYKRCNQRGRSRGRESGTAPEFIIAEHVANNKVDMTRPLCAYPQVATYKGVGSTNDAANFSCKAP